jgi:hypothetical protein
MTSGSAILSENVKKIAKGPGVVGGVVGGAEELGEYLAWIRNGADFKKIPNGTGTGFVVFDRSVRKNKKVELFIIDKNKYVEVPLTLEQDYYADGSGYKVALGTLHTGASAWDAVNAAIRHDNQCGGEIFMEELW